MDDHAVFAKDLSSRKRIAVMVSPQKIYYKTINRKDDSMETYAGKNQICLGMRLA